MLLAHSSEGRDSTVIVLVLIFSRFLPAAGSHVACDLMHRIINFYVLSAPQTTGARACVSTGSTTQQASAST